MRLVLMLSFLLFSASPVSAFKTLDTLRLCTSGNVPEQSIRQDFLLQHFVGSKEERRIIGKLYLQRSPLRTMDANLRILQPEDMNGITYLYLQGASNKVTPFSDRFSDRLFAYLPALKKSTQVSGQSAASQLLGTNFSLADLQHIYGGFSGSVVKMGEKTTVRGRSVYPVTVIPTDEDTPYKEVQAFVDSKTCLTVETRFTGHNGKLIKLMWSDMNKVLRLDGRFVAHEFTVEDPITLERSVLSLGGVAYDEKIGAARFHPEGFFK